MKIALCICPQWSIESPSYALGVLKSEINNPNVEVKQFDINMDSSIYMRDVDYEFWYDWGNDKPWNSDNNFREYFKLIGVPIIYEFKSSKNPYTS